MTFGLGGLGHSLLFFHPPAQQVTFQPSSQHLPSLVTYVPQQTGEVTHRIFIKKDIHLQLRTWNTLK